MIPKLVQSLPNSLTNFGIGALAQSLRAVKNRKHPLSELLWNAKTTTMTTEVLFYHLMSQSLERVLPTLLEKSLERGWRAVVEFGSEERRDALDAALWEYSDASFLPHSAARDGTEAEQPIWLTCGQDRPNGAHIRFLVDRARPAELELYERVVLMFNGHDEEALRDAREDWKQLKSAGHAVTYWQQNERGRWEKKA